MLDATWIACGALFVSIFSLWLSYNNYMTIGKNKALDLRITLGKTIVEVNASLQKMPDLINASHKSRNAVMSARGLLRSGAAQIWDEQCSKDKVLSKSLAEQFAPLSQGYEKESVEMLEKRLMSVHQVQIDVAHIIDRYNASMNDDNEQRKIIQTQHVTTRG